MLFRGPTIQERWQTGGPKKNDFLGIKTTKHLRLEKAEVLLGIWGGGEKKEEAEKGGSYFIKSPIGPFVTNRETTPWGFTSCKRLAFGNEKCPWGLWGERAEDKIRKSRL